MRVVQWNYDVFRNVHQFWYGYSAQFGHIFSGVHLLCPASRVSTETYDYICVWFCSATITDKGYETYEDYQALHKDDGGFYKNECWYLKSDFFAYYEKSNSRQVAWYAVTSPDERQTGGVKMVTFSQWYGYKSSVLQLEIASDTLKIRILAAFYKQEFDSYDTFDWTNYTTGIEDMMIEMGFLTISPKMNW